MEKEEWKLFRNALDKKDKKEFDEMFDIPDFTFLLALILFSWCAGGDSLVPSSSSRGTTTSTSLKWKRSTLPFPCSYDASLRREFTLHYSYHIVKEC
jgi:hypothetical protein